MYEYRAELKDRGKFPIVRTYQGKTRTEAIVEMTAKERIEREQQNPEEVTPKITSKVTPKDILQIPTSQTFEEDGSLESDTQNISQSTTQKADLMISNDGWVPLFRKSMKSQVFQNEKLWKLWTWCLMKVSHIEQWVPVKTGKGMTEVHLKPGQFIFGRHSAAKELRMKESTVYGLMGKLKNMRNLDTQTNTHFSIVSLTNWGFYKELMKKVTGKETPKEQPRNTYKNYKKKDIYCQTSNEVRLSKFLLSSILERRNTFKKPDLQKWARHIDLMIRIDKREPGEIENVIKWCQANAFWQNNILSTGTLRKQYDQLALKMEEVTNEGSRSERFDEKDW